MKIQVVHGDNGTAVYLGDLHVAGVQPIGEVFPDLCEDLDEAKIAEIMNLCAEPANSKIANEEKKFYLELPCDIGGLVWVLHRLTRVPIPVEVIHFMYTGSGIRVEYKYLHEDYTDAGMYGKSVFASREEAEEKLRKSESENPFIEAAHELVDLQNAGKLPDDFCLDEAVCDPKFTKLLIQLPVADAVSEYCRNKEA